MLFLSAAVLVGANVAQVNAEVLRPNPLQPGWAVGIDGSLAVSRGNIDLLDVGAGVRVLFQTLHPDASELLPFIAQRAFLTSTVRFAERADATFINQGFVHLRWTGMWHRRIGSDLFAQYQFNEFLLLSARAVAGTGARIEVVHRRDLMIWSGTGYLFEYNRIRPRPGASDPRETFEHRWTNYATVRLAILDELLLLQNTIYYQPRLDRLADFRFLEELEALTRVTPIFGLGCTLSVLYDSAPPTGVKKGDLRLLSTVRLSF